MRKRHRSEDAHAGVLTTPAQRGLRDENGSQTILDSMITPPSDRGVGGEGVNFTAQADADGELQPGDADHRARQTRPSPFRQSVIGPAHTSMLTPRDGARHRLAPVSGRKHRRREARRERREGVRP